ncbi:hypothetical protein AB0J83_19705 [Actinoplanes sp. NPDC049596]|uniref:hypothetical protein n=1 Tax=unclassified Actinoplanes TaxID=2626549 RepID=UPI003417AA20
MRSLLFDAARYDREVLRPLRGTHGHLPPGDLLARYAVDPAMEAAELARHLTEIRAWWRERARAPDFRAEVCKLLIRADEELRRTSGDALDDPAWWREQAHLSPVTEEPGPGSPADAPAAAEGPARPHDWRSDVRAQFWSALARLDRAPAGQATATTAGPVVVEEEPRTDGDGLRVEETTAAGDRARVRLTWPDTGVAVRVRCSPRPTPIVDGAVVDTEQADQWGAVLPGEPVRRGGHLVLEADVGTGYLYYQPFEADGERERAGRPVGLIIARPVRHLRIDRDGDGALVSWEWPQRATSIEAEFAGERRAMTRSEYTAANGLRFGEARAGGDVVVRAFTPVGEGLARSAPVSASLSPAPAVIAYDLKRKRRLAGADLVVTLTADRDCAGVDLEVVLTVGEFMPRDPGDGRRVARRPGLTLTAGTPLRLTLPWPEVGRDERPYWIRCFFHAPFDVAPDDPDPDRMRTR